MSLRPVRLMIVLILLLGGSLAWLWFDENAEMRSLNWVPPAALKPELTRSTTPLQPAASAPNPTENLAMLERPLFAPDRRPAPPPAPPVAPPPPDPFASIQLFGVVSGENQSVLARVDGKVRRVKVSESIGDWTLKGVNGREVTFARGEESRQVRLNYSRLGPPSAQAAATSNAPPQTPTNTVSGTGTALQVAQDEARERFRRANELRASRGLPVIVMNP